MAVTAIDGEQVTVENKDPLVLPATLEVTYTDGTKERVRIPVEAWEMKGTMVFMGAKAVASATVDPDKQLPDDDRSDNTKVAGK
jgi:hypothetical protein